MTDIDSRAIVIRYVQEVLNAKDPGAMEELVANDNLRHRTEAFCRAFPDSYLTIEEMIAEDDKVAVHMSGRGTHMGALRGIEPTGREVNLPCTAIYKVTGGRITDFLVTWDLLSLVF